MYTVYVQSYIKLLFPFLFFLHYYVYTALLSESSSLIKATSVVFPLKHKS